MKEYVIKYEYITEDRIKVKANSAKEAREKIREMGQGKGYTHYSIKSILLQGESDESKKV